MSDLKATCEYQEARMEAKEVKAETEPKGAMGAVPPWDRRSLRRKNKEKMRDRKRSEDEAGKQV